jgi:hypothetical protein
MTAILGTPKIPHFTAKDHPIKNIRDITGGFQHNEDDEIDGSLDALTVSIPLKFIPGGSFLVNKYMRKNEQFAKILGYVQDLLIYIHIELKKRKLSSWLFLERLHHEKEQNNISLPNSFNNMNLFEDSLILDDDNEDFEHTTFDSHEYDSKKIWGWRILLVYKMDYKTKIEEIVTHLLNFNAIDEYALHSVDNKKEKKKKKNDLEVFPVALKDLTFNLFYEICTIMGHLLSHHHINNNNLENSEYEVTKVFTLENNMKFFKDSENQLLCRAQCDINNYHIDNEISIFPISDLVWHINSSNIMPKIVDCLLTPDIKLPTVNVTSGLNKSVQKCYGLTEDTIQNYDLDTKCRHLGAEYSPNEGVRIEVTATGNIIKSYETSIQLASSTIEQLKFELSMEKFNRSTFQHFCNMKEKFMLEKAMPWFNIIWNVFNPMTPVTISDIVTWELEQWKDSFDDVPTYLNYDTDYWGFDPTLSYFCNRVIHRFNDMENAGVIWQHPIGYAADLSVRSALNLKPSSQRFNIILNGDPGIGKSYILNHTYRKAVPGSCRMIGHFTTQVFSRLSGDLTGCCLMFHEAQSVGMGARTAKKESGTSDALQFLKTLLADGVGDLYETTYENGIPQVKTTKLKTAFTMIQNVNEGSAGSSESMADRFFIIPYLELARADNVKARHITYTSTTESSKKYKQRYELQERYQHVHHAKTSIAMTIGAIQDIDMTIPAIYLNLLIDKLHELGCGKEASSQRIFGRFFSVLREEVIRYAVEAANHSPGCDRVTGSNAQEINFNALKATEGYLVATEDITWFVFSLLASQYLDPVQQAIFSILTESVERTEESLRDKKFHVPTISDDNGEEVEQNELYYFFRTTDLSVHIKNLMSTLQTTQGSQGLATCSHDAIKRTLGQLNGRQIKIKREGSEHEEYIDMFININGQGHANKGVAVAKAALKKMDPLSIIKQVIRETWHAQTRDTSYGGKRKILLGVQVEGYPYLLETMEVEKRPDRIITIGDTTASTHLCNIAKFMTSGEDMELTHYTEQFKKAKIKIKEQGSSTYVLKDIEFTTFLKHCIHVGKPKEYAHASTPRYLDDRVMHHVHKYCPTNLRKAGSYPQETIIADRKKNKGKSVFSITNPNDIDYDEKDFSLKRPGMRFTDIPVMDVPSLSNFTEVQNRLYNNNQIEPPPPPPRSHTRMINTINSNEEDDDEEGEEEEPMNEYTVTPPPSPPPLLMTKRNHRAIQI